MKAIVYEEYGSPDVLSVADVPVPEPGDDEVLVRIRAASVNDWDWGLLNGRPFLTRLAGRGPFKPFYKILGTDVAGEVVKVGSAVTKFQVGNAVFGDVSESGFGSFAEYNCYKESALTLKPDSMTFEQAAALPHAATLALQGLRDQGKLQPGQHVLINGAGGGAGTLAIQMAKDIGATITGVDKGHKFERMQSLGADHVIDYQQRDFTENGEQYDLILDFSAWHPMADYRRATKPDGAYIQVGGSMSLAFRLMLTGWWVKMTGGPTMGILFHKPNRGMDDVISLFEAGHVIPLIDRRFPLQQVPDALAYFGQGMAIGKIIVNITDQS